MACKYKSEYIVNVVEWMVQSCDWDAEITGGFSLSSSCALDKPATISCI